MKSLKRASASIAAVSLLAGMIVAVPSTAQAATSRSSSRVLRWSSASTWGGNVPGPGANVRIPSGSKVLLDVSPPELDGLQIDGTLTFARKNLELRSDWIIVHGALKVGTAKRPFRQRAVITLTGNDPAQNVMDMGTKMIGVMGGSLDLHGRRRAGWTQLGSNAASGSRTLTLKRRMPWQRGDRIVVASSDYRPEHAEQRTITSMSGRKVTLDEPLEYQHWGRLQRFGGRVLDERTEVGLLSRNVVVRGDDSSMATRFGGHIMVMEGGEARISDVELTRMGQFKRMRRYPVHFHMDGTASGSYVRRASIHQTYNRCVTVHGTRRLRVLSNVCYDNLGHSYFLEDGGETDNVLKNNLGVWTREVEDGLLESDERPATFWITNPDNVIEGNVAAGSEGHGFWYALPEHPTGPSSTSRIWPQRTPLKLFTNNVTHSNDDTGLMVDDGPDENGDISGSTWYDPRRNPADEDSAPVVARFDRLTAYMNRNRAVWLRGDNHVVTRARFGDNAAGATFASEDSYLKNSLVVGETANKGNPESWENTGPGGRMMPAYWEPEHPIVGFEFYDGTVGVSDTYFAGFKPNAMRESGALSYLAPNAFTISPRNFASNLSFANDAKRVYLAPPERGMDGDMSKLFVDRDGSVTGRKNARVVIDNPFLLDDTCNQRGAWGAWVCGANEYATLWVEVSNPSAIEPLKIHRPDATQTLVGCCSGGDKAITTILPQRTYELEFSQAPTRTELILWNSGRTDVTLKMKTPATTKVIRWDDPLPGSASLQGLANKDDSSWFYDHTTGYLHVRVVSDDDWSEVEVVRS